MRILVLLLFSFAASFQVLEQQPLSTTPPGVSVKSPSESGSSFQAAEGTKTQSKKSDDSQSGSGCGDRPSGMVIPCNDPKPVCKDSQGNVIRCKKKNPPAHTECDKGAGPQDTVIPCTDPKEPSGTATGTASGKKRLTTTDKAQ